MVCRSAQPKIEKKLGSTTIVEIEVHQGQRQDDGAHCTADTQVKGLHLGWIFKTDCQATDTHICRKFLSTLSGPATLAAKIMNSYSVLGKVHAASH